MKEQTANKSAKIFWD